LPLMSETLRKGGRIVLGIHDLIPLHYPGLSKASDAEAFRAWLESAVPMADAIVTVSRTVAGDICEYLSMSGLRHKPNLRIGWEHLGADFAADSRAAPSREIVDICDQGPFFLTVGLIEPRKGHAVALSAFEKLWTAGIDARYLIIGGCSQSSLAVRQRILRHREYGRRLFWLSKANDADLIYAYSRARSLVYPSCAEGFGLPLVEAARCGVPVIASDIPVFREIGGDSIAYFNLLDADALANRIRDALAGKTVKPSFAIMTWREATQRLLRRVRNGDYQFSLAAKSTMNRSAAGMF
jgi:glycosyltransferase involved in cell wall biosynthesis